MYDEQIKYYSDETWRKYFSVDLAQLYSSVEGLLTLRDSVIQQISDKTVGDLIKESNLWKDVLFGGFTANESKPYSENALAKFYDECFGICIENPSLVISRLKEGLPLESASEGVRCMIKEETAFVKTLREMSSKLKAIYKSLRSVVDEPKAKEYVADDPYFGVNAVKDVLNAGKKLLPLYNPLSFFVTSVYSIPRFYAQEAYPKLFEENSSKVLGRYGIHLTKLLEPDLPDEKIRSEREVVGLAEGCVGWLLREVILDVYSLFQLDALKRFFTLEDEFAKFVKMNAGKLKESIVVSQFSGVVSALRGEYFTEYLDDKKRCKISDPFKFRYSREYGSDRDYRGKVENGEIKIGYEGRTRLNYTEFVAFLAPIMFLGLAYIRPISEKEFAWCCLLGWEE